MTISARPVLPTNDRERYKLVTGTVTALRFQRIDNGFIQAQIWVDNKLIDAVYTPKTELIKWLNEEYS